MKKIQMFSLLSLLAFTLLTVNSSTQIVEAAYYGYVNESGNLVYVEANTVAGAFTNSTNIADTSGVIFSMYNNGNISTNINEGYLYVNGFGVVTQVDANTAVGAFQNSTNIADQSGVMLINSITDGNIVGNNVSGI